MCVCVCVIQGKNKQHFDKNISPTAFIYIYILAFCK